MKNFNYLLLIVVILISVSCTTSYRMKRGKVVPSKFKETIDITTKKGIVLIPCEYEGEVENYYFDTGAQLTDIQREELIGERVEVRGATNRTIESGTEVLKSFKIGTIEFKNTFATNSDSKGLKEQIRNFGGTLGRPIINRANWLIDRDNKKVTLSNEDLSDDGFSNIELIPNKTGAPHTMIMVEGKPYKAIIDLGSTAMLNVPRETELAKILTSKYEFTERKRDRYTVGGNQEVEELICVIPSIQVGELEYRNVLVTINQSSQIRVGINLFREKLIYIDNKNKQYRVK